MSVRTGLRAAAAAAAGIALEIVAGTLAEIVTEEEVVAAAAARTVAETIETVVEDVTGTVHCVLYSYNSSSFWRKIAIVPDTSTLWLLATSTLLLSYHV